MSRSRSQGASYSAFRHLAKSLLLGRWDHSWWAIFMGNEISAYFDESRLEDRFPVVAGFVGRAETWIAIEKRLPGGLKSKKHYRKQEDALAMAKALNLAFFPIYTTLDRDLHRKLFAQMARYKKTPEARKNAYIHLVSNAYAFCSWSCCQLLDRWAEQSRLREEHWPIKVIFDEGSAYKNSFERGYKKYYGIKRDTYLSRVPIFEDGDSLLPLKAADFYAWHLSRFYNTGQETEALRLIHEINPPQKMEIAGPQWEKLLSKID